MPRAERIHIPEGCYHVMMRGNGKKQIFFEDLDWRDFISLLKLELKKYDHKIHAHCLMSNHVHLLIQAGSTPISSPLHNATFRHTKKLNKKFSTVGHQFQGRYKGYYTHSNEYKMNVLKYIHRNPIEAQMVKFSHEYKYSSHNHYTKWKPLEWVERKDLLRLFSDDLNKAVKLYNEFIDDPLSPKAIEEIEENVSRSIVELQHENSVDEQGNSIVPYTKRLITIDDIIETTCDEFEIDQFYMRIRTHFKK